MKDLKFHDVFIHVRDPKKGENFANQYGVSVRPELSWEDYDILINATPVGMPHTPVQDELPFSQKEIDSAKIVCDCVVAPNGNPLTTLMADLEKPLVSGLELTIRQAVEQSCLYTEISLDFQMALKIAEKALGLDLKYLYDSI